MRRLSAAVSELIADLLRASVGAELPRRAKARIGSAVLTDVKPAQYHTDLVVLLEGRTGKYGIIVEVQLSVDRRKRYTWPVYVTSLRAQLRCPVSVVVVTPDENVARWAAKRVMLGYDNDFAPLVVSPSALSQIVSEMRVRGDPELSTLMAIMHNRDRDSRVAAAVAASALKVLRRVDTDVSRLYSDFLERSMRHAVREALQRRGLLQYDPNGVFASQFIKDGRKQGREEGRTQGCAALLIRQLTLRFGALPDRAQAYLNRASIDELDRIGERVLTAPTLQRALGKSYRRTGRARKARSSRAS